MGKYIKVNGCKLPVNVSDIAFIERLTTANNDAQTAMASAEVNFPGDDPQAVYKRMEACVNATCTFYDDLYGAGTAERIFHRTNDAAVYMKSGQEFASKFEKLVAAFSRRYKYCGTLKVDTELKT